MGLLYDLFSGVEPGVDVGGHDDGQRRMWELDVHFTDWPDEQLVRLDAEGRVMHDAFVNGVKEVGGLLDVRTSYP